MTTVAANSDYSIYDALGLSQREKAEEKKTSLGQDDFLALLTTQLANQDPFKPMENTDMVAQMAQFSSLEGITDMSTSLNKLQDSFASSQALQASSLVGRQVLMPLTEGYIEQGETLSGSIAIPEPASDVHVSIVSSNGEAVRDFTVVGADSIASQGAVPFTWDGLNSAGDKMPSGTYYVKATALINGERQALDTGILAQVESVSMVSGQGDLTLNLAGIGTVSINDVVNIQ